ncbi:MAG: hypothetical protein Q8P41_00965 [Pseudomonadota bacterium]|nr:hypothetical protein [Pseudomonadota bacterium]
MAILAALALPAFASGWSPFENTFPALPCQDGWAACLVDGTVGGGVLKDAAGRPLPADARFGWFDLKATQNVSPFTTLSAYNGPIGGAVAEAPQPPPEVRPTRTPDSQVADTTQNNGGSTTSAEGGWSSGGKSPSDPSTGASTGGSTVTPTAVASNTTTTTTGASTSGSGMRPGSPSNPATTGTTTTPTTTTTSGGGMRPGSPSSTGTTTGTMAPTPGTAQTVSNTPPVTSNPTTTTNNAVVAPVASAPQDDSCDDLVKLEPSAMMGQLRVGQSKCLEGRVASEGQQTTKDKVSRIMITNAEAKGDKSEWERLMKRHLEDIDRSDPDLCFKYALHLSRGGTGRAQGVIRWADYALENKAKWSGQTYKTRVFGLYKLRAEAANKLWQEAEKEFAEGERSDEKEAKAAKYRGQAKDYAREWLDYAKASTQDTKTAMALCVSSSGNRAFCEGG